MPNFTLILNYLLWNGDPSIVSIGSFSLRWYGLLFALGFLISQQVLYYMFRKEGKPQSDVDVLTVYMVIATLLGARLGHVIFYQPDMFWINPVGVFLPFEFTPEFRFTGLQGLASHGGSIGILTALWLYSKKKKQGQNYLQILDRIVIVVALTGALIRLGNFFNSEIIGKPTDSQLGVVFVNRVTRSIMQDHSDANPVLSVAVEKNMTMQTAGVSTEGAVQPFYLKLTFKPTISKEVADSYIQSTIRFYLSYMGEYVKLPKSDVLEYDFYKQRGSLSTKVSLLGIVRHPAQLYESFSSFLLFLLLFYIWSRKRENTPTGLIFGIFMIILWGLRFGYEFIKENQVPFESALPLNMGQILSIPLFIVGILILVRVYKSSLSSR